MGSNDMPELGSKISLISKADIRYEGKLFTVDPQDCTIALANVRSFGTEDRVTDHPVPAQAQVYDYILFRATDIKDISVIPSPPVLFDPAIVQLSVPPSIGSSGGSRFQTGFQHPIVGAFGSGASEPSSRTVGSGTQSSYNPMQASNLLNPLQQRSRQTSESQRHNGSVAELLGNSGASVGGGGGAGTGGSRSSTPGLGRRISEQGTQSGGNNQRQSPPRYGVPDQANQRNRNNSQSNTSNHEDRSFNTRQYSQTKPRDQQQPQQQQQQQARFGNRNMDNGFNRNDGGYNNRDNRNDGGFIRDGRNDGGFMRDNRNDNGFNRDNRNDGGFNRNILDMYGNRNNQQHMQQRRYQNQPGGLQNQRVMNPRGGSGDRLQDQQQRGGLGGQRRNQGWSNNNQRQGGGARQGQRQGNQRRQFAFNGQPKQQPSKQPLKFDSDYDFDKANTEFEELRLSLAQVKIADGNNAVAPAANPPAANADDKKDDSGNETAVGECDQEDEGIQQSSSAYDKTKSFFDNISCEAIERSKGAAKPPSGNETAVGERGQEDEGIQQSTSAFDKTKSFFDNISCEAIERSKGRSQRTDWRKELKLNSETFGVTMSRRFYIPRGRGYYNRGSSWNYKPRQQQNNMITAKV